MEHTNRKAAGSTSAHAEVSQIRDDAGNVTHMVVPIEQYHSLMEAAASQAPSTDAIARAAAMLNDPSTRWHDAESVLHDLLDTGVQAVRSKAGMTQAALGKAAGMPQSQVSRLEKNLENASVKTVRRIADVIATSQTEPKPKRKLA
jgi:DNA-binding XRE family transcriptional regulator